ncbi:autotransporter outer membrane beta-barrel domain-containing protein [Pseudomonas synxantha]|uniref:Autotransporter domain-containing protein n=1 Tax=Pseudomonas synxantha TaxID=47883 RepID=A0ABS0US88_9PSED|nr:autotransporter outer membrane beta-barrel domain-containing protein [Pseudomonas synxantha]MBI6568474.1 autotransporter domain-containing protein [Pseudomonas synxantha]MBI6584798.1 autotransporter domain-containing protein [Pseudomonas synxantha]MBI6647246.1 autotransporter domain-containing protein [Pseudomonas synxantha]
MKRKQFQKSLLAIMVGAISTQVLAIEFDLGQGKNIWASESFNEPVTITGQFSRVVDANTTDPAGLGFANTQIQGSLINRADITLDSQGGTIRAIAIDPMFWTGPTGLAPSTVTGDVVQAGNVLMRNGAYEGLEIGPTTIGGSLINSGTIRSTPPVGTVTTPGYLGGGEGIYLHGTTIAGDVSNTGVIDMAGPGAIGLILDVNGDTPTTIGGKILNSGSITATGEGAWGVEVETDTSPLRIENSGLISANGDEAKGLFLYGGTFDYILNTGTIEAKGASANAFDLSGASFAQNSATGARGIVNRGLIAADGTAIHVDTAEQVASFEINQQAGEIRSNSGIAVDANNLASLNWTGGKITGDLLNLSAVNIGGQAGFSGSRIIAPVSVNSGSLNLSAPGTAITGDLNVASGAGIDMHLADSVVPTTPYLTVNGTANLAQASKLTVSANPGDFAAPKAGTQYTLLQATSVQNNGVAVASASSLLNVLSYSADAQTVKAVVAVKSDQQVQQELAGVSAGASAATAVNVLKNDVLGQLNQNDPVFQSLANAGTAQQLAQLADQLTPDVNRGALDVALSGQTVVNGAIFNRLTDQRESHQVGGVWVQGLSSNMDQDGRGGNNGYSANSSGMAVGVDGRLNDTTTLGVAYSYLNSNIHSDLGNKTDVEGHALSLYGNWALQNWFVDGSLSYGHNENDSKRHVAGTTAKGSYDSNVLSASVIGGYSFKPTQAVVIEPRVAARYANVRMDGFTEKGSSAALSTASQRYEVGELGAGVRLAANLPLSAGTLQPEATLMAYHDLMGDRVAQTSNFVAGGSAFTVTGASVARDSYEASVGVNYKVSDFTVGASYTRQARSGFDADGVMLKARYAF